MWHNYYTVTSLDEALALLAQHGERARIVAGATDLMLELERRVRPQVDTLIDLTRVPGLDALTLGDDGEVHLGPLVTHNAVAASSLIRQRARLLAQACWEVGAPQIRNRATVAGNLITASPANDTITPLIALDAVVTLASTRGERRVRLRDFYTGVRRTVMAPDEVLTGIAFRPLPEGARGMFLKVGLRRVQAISVVNAAVIVELDGDVVRAARIALGSVAPTIVRAPEAEASLAGQPLTDAALDAAAELAARAARPIDDVRGPAGYRQNMVRVAVRRALENLRRDPAPGWMPADPVMLWGPHAGRAAGLEASWTAGAAIETTVNGRAYAVTGAQHKSLMRMLREDLGLIGTKEGCAEGECGACTVYLDGAAVMSCLVPAPRAHGSQLVTIEGLAPTPDDLHPLQQAFIREGAVQCGYCTPGLLMAGAKALEERGRLSRWEAEQAIAGNLCRCTGYYKVLRALEAAAAEGAPA